MRENKDLDNINLVKASAWAAHHEYLKELKRKPEERKTAKEEKK